MRKNGFTLIELMIAVALVGVLAAIAMQAYNDYIDTTNTVVVHDRYEQAVRTVRWEYSTTHAAVSNGLPRDVPETADLWIQVLDVNNARAPGGGPAYVEGSGIPATGAIGVVVSGAWGTADSNVTISRPAYGDLPAVSENVTM